MSTDDASDGVSLGLTVAEVLDLCSLGNLWLTVRLRVFNLEGVPDPVPLYVVVRALRYGGARRFGAGDGDGGGDGGFEGHLVAELA